MPAKNVIKPYIAGGFYHLYNRGVEKRIIFEDEQDYKVFLTYLKDYLVPARSTPDRPFINQPNLAHEIKLLAFSLIPNHFHFLVWQKTEDAIKKLIQCLGTKYVIYFNKRHDRVGRLFQGTYKGVLVETEEQLLHLSRYIHLNPLKDSPLRRSILLGAYSSYKAYLGRQKIEWLYPGEILSFFKTAQKTDLKDILSYQSFVEDYQKEPEDVLGGLMLE